MKKAFITDWLDKFGGAERVVAAINEIFIFDYYFAYTNQMKEDDLQRTFGRSNVKILTSNILSLAGKNFRFLLPIFPFISDNFNKQIKKKDVSILISSSWVLSKSFRLDNEIHICYLQARNFKYVWDEVDLYFKGPKKILKFLIKPLRKFDLESAKNPDYLIANSQFVQNWVLEKYKRHSEVIYPPVDVDDFYISKSTEGYFITVGRLEPYKRFDIVVEAFTKNGCPLIVIGDGTQLQYLKSIAGPNIIFKGFLNKDQIRKYLSEAKAFVYAGVEDFGIVIVEAHASGIPTIVFEGGASKEIVNSSNGLCYKEQNANSLNKMLKSFEDRYSNYDKLEIRKSSLKYSKSRFKLEFKQYVEKVLNVEFSADLLKKCNL